MTDPYPPLSVPASPDYFLALFRLDDDLFDLADDQSAAYLATFVGVNAWDRRRGLRDALPLWFGVDVTADFDRELPTLRGRTVGDVCRFLADRVPRATVRPWLSDCAAGAFLTVRHQLAAAGADLAGVRPSAPLEPYLRRHPAAFGLPLQLLAPGLPFIRRTRPVVWIGAAIVLVGAAYALLACSLALAGVRLDTDLPFGIGVASCFLGTLVVMVGHALPPRRVTLGGLVTFRDLARAVAVQQPA